MTGFKACLRTAAFQRCLLVSILCLAVSSGLALGQESASGQVKSPPASEAVQTDASAKTAENAAPAQQDKTGGQPEAKRQEQTPQATALKPPKPGSEPVPPPVDLKPADASESQSLETFFQNQRTLRDRLDNTYLVKVFGLLAFLLVGFYLSVRFFMPLLRPGLAPTGISRPMGRQSRLHSPQGIFSWLNPFRSITSHNASPPRPRVLSRLRLGPAKEIHVVEIEGRQLVVGSTNQQITLLTELSENGNGSAPQYQPQSRENRAFKADDEVYRKYLAKPVLPVPDNTVAMPTHEEIVLLEDYEDEFDRS